MISVQLTETGPVAPDFPTLLTELQSNYKSIFGEDIYIDPDSQDGQLIAIFASAMNDCNIATINAINSFSPTYANGTGLSSVVKINGIQRLVPTHSTAFVVLTGQVGKTIINGQVEDIYGNKWNLPSPLTFPSFPIAGELTTTVTAVEAGAINVAVGEINKISTPTLGWQSVTNTFASVPGAPVEQDSELRLRQTQSVSLPALTVRQSIEAGIANIPGVLHHKVYENDTSATVGVIPSHSIWCVVQGGTSSEIGSVIAHKKAPGTGTYGSATAFATIGGTTIPVKYSPATITEVSVRVYIMPGTGYNTSVDATIITRTLTAFTNLDIATPLEYTKVVAASTGPEYNVTGVRMTKTATPVWATTDIIATPAEILTANPASIEVILGIP